LPLHLDLKITCEKAGPNEAPSGALDENHSRLVSENDHLRQPAPQSLTRACDAPQLIVGASLNGDLDTPAEIASPNNVGQAFQYWHLALSGEPHHVAAARLSEDGL
jgi:hypothetical protein